MAGAEDIATRIMDEVRQNLGEAWRSVLSADQRALIEAVAADAAALTILAMANSRSEASDRMLIREKAQINAQLKNIAAAETARVQTALWGAVRTVVNGAVQLVFSI